MRKSTLKYLLVSLLLSACTIATSACEPSSDSDRSGDTGSARDSSDRDGSPTNNITPPKLWPPYENRCASTHSLVALPDLSPELLEVPDQIEAELVWTQSPACAGAPAGSARGASYGSAALSEGASGATIVAEYRYSGEFGYGTGALTRLSADDGNPLDCELFPAEGLSTGRPIILHPALDDAPILAAYRQDMGDGAAGPYLSGWGITWYSPAWDTPLQGMGGPAVRSSGGARTKLLPDGQLLIFTYAEHIISIDSYSGALNWIVKPEDVEFLKKVDLQTIAHRAEHDDFVMQFIDLSEPDTHKFIAIDRCGHVEGISREAFQAAIRIEFGDGYLIPIYAPDGSGFNKYDLRIESKDGDLQQIYRNCERSVSLAQDVVACLRTIPRNHETGSPKQLEISIIRWGQDQATSMILGNSNEREQTSFNINSPVSFRDGVLSLTQEVVPVDEHNVQTADAITRLFFINWQTAQVLKTVDMPWVRNHPPLLSEGGMLIFNYDLMWAGVGSSELYGVQTNLHGLSPTAFPRGLALGRNRNLGAYSRGGVQD